MPSYPQQQQCSRLARAAGASALSAAAALLAMLAAAGGLPPIAFGMLLASVGFALRARRLARLATRARVGARSEDQVHRALAPLEAEGWRLRHSLNWQGRGDIDSIAISPTGLAFTIETKTRTFTSEDLARIRDIAGWLHTRRRHWCPKGTMPVLCVVSDHGLEHVEAGVLVVSIDRLAAALRTAASTRRRPAFLSPPRSPKPTT